MSKRTILIAALDSTPKDLTFLLRRMEETAVHQRLAFNEWSIADVLSHLATIEPLYLARLQRIVGEERPYLPYLHPETMPQPTSTPLADLFAAFSAARQTTLDYLKSLKAGEWQRPAIHQTAGPTKFRYMVQMLVDHDTEHLTQIAQIQQQLRTS